ncbi:MAG: 4-hydroxyphenylacetate 3-monooxygenase, oxygenase component [Armatimonadota bacterium]|nr:4-hydroxyphenylacetate 3-monooxygenase, oxygenase component [Armatimonadota bacterium]MDR7421465.1 4-hydroxyphenylacetate 3-monooxygenase, oxygenase component [Armatimonadota bacterium]MDR7453057.1 4-hydroxyphenylacetate 3-monooxygenase, oxygenase component [Armatimonadota bacterium]MDR7457523.1 4-hydroxyphenylacetate 3-monooxygenase, oxygenase component [Armatimonadota bacterium]MDR7497185.1 4-hydroxyphenylacetate 3-monooxygenase, oxygenase component [Armatimonadota bacterium]
MGARTGAQFLDGLRAHPPEIWVSGDRVRDPVAHPAFRNVVRSVAALYDMQHEPALRDEMTYASPSSGERVGLSFLVPRTHDDLVRVRRMMKRWADYSGGMMGRSPDYLNRALAAYAAAADYMAANDPRFGEHVRRYYEFVREGDLCLTHTLINPQSNRAVGPARQADPYLAAGVVRETDAGIVVRGARMLATLPLADEIMVFPSTVLRGGAEDAPYAFAFAIPTATPGLRFICRESFDYGRDPRDHPLASRFEEMDAVVVFDDVLVPWERVFLLRDVERCNRAFAETRAVVHMAHQVVVKNVAKTEFLLGLVCLMVDAIAIEGFQHVQEKVAEVIQTLEAMRAFLRAAEADAALDRWGMMTPAWPPLDAARNLFPRAYPRMVEIVHQLGASGLMAIPTSADLDGPLGAVIETYYQAARADARSRIRLFRLAWDAALSAFGGRQALYERFFFGDPVRMAGAMFANYDKAPYMERVRAFLGRVEDEAARPAGERP